MYLSQKQSVKSAAQFKWLLWAGWMKEILLLHFCMFNIFIMYLLYYMCPYVVRTNDWIAFMAPLKRSVKSD